jgi:hypothetical protein
MRNFIPLLLLILALPVGAADVPTARVAVMPRSLLDMFGLSVFFPATKGDKIDVTVTSGESDVYRVTIVGKSGTVQRQIVERPTVQPCPTCERYLPMATFWLEGGLEKVIVEALIAGPPAASAGY